VSQVLVPVIGQVAQLRGIVEPAASIEQFVKDTVKDGIQGLTGIFGLGGGG
jgi:hypothetical protein